MRSQAREVVFKFIFSQLFNQNDEGLFAYLKKEEGLNEADSMFADSLLAAVKSGYDAYINKIQNVLISYKIERLFNADKCALLLGIAELENFKETPKIVIIDEAVKLASKYSTEKSTDFVNGVLAGFAKSL